ncbi:MAG: DUF2164 domain-containing protein [Clostridiales bacterium]|nr:DUF2164 domain-containing protein [Clostridiales bacterium]
MVRKGNKIKVAKDKQEEMINELRQYFYTERGEELGELAASMLLDFITEKLAPEFYNQGIIDAYNYINEKAEDMLGLQK